MRSVALAALGLLAVLARGEQPLLSDSDDAFLHDQARRLVALARLPPGTRNRTPYVMHVPGGNMGYPAFWVRDAVMMLGGDLVSSSDLEDWIRLMCSVLRKRDWHVRPGVVVPAYAVPDHINFDGRATFYPGNLETGSRQGGAPWGKYPPLDDHFYFIHAVYEHWRMTGSTALLQAKMPTAFGHARLMKLCQRVYHVAPVDPETGLCVAGDIHAGHVNDFGFCDTVSKSGKLLFPSVLRFTAARELAAMFRALGKPRKALAFERDAAAIQLAIAATFLHAGWLHSATGVGNQPDVWGSAFAVYSGAVDADTARRVALTLAGAYRDQSAVRDGCVRHLPGNAVWEATLSPPGEYQNGGYWGTASGWYIAAINTVDPAAARDMARDYLQFLRTQEAWEWFNPDTGKHNNPQYVATVALPYVTLHLLGRATRPSSNLPGLSRSIRRFRGCASVPGGWRPAARSS